jgi:hypothetical protein
MKIYFFGGETHYVDVLYENGFDGTLMLYNARSGDKFMQVARTFDPLKDKMYNKDFKYMIALRPYVISPQYVCMMNQSMRGLTGKSLQINLISGHTKEEEKDYGGIIGEVNDLSETIDKSKYMIEFIDTIAKMDKHSQSVPDIYVSATNKYTYDAAKKYGYKTILPYSKLLSNFFDDIDKEKVMLSIGPILRDTEEDFGDLLKGNKPDDSKYFTHKQFKEFLDDIERQGFREVILFGWPDEEQRNIISFVKKYKENNI